MAETASVDELLWGLDADRRQAFVLTRLVGPSRALELLVGNVTLDPPAARDLGLVNRVVPAAAPDRSKAFVCRTSRATLRS